MDSRDPETEIGSLEIEKRVHRIHDPLETGLQMMPRIGGPHNGDRQIPTELLACLVLRIEGELLGCPVVQFEGRTGLADPISFFAIF